MASEDSRNRDGFRKFIILDDARNLSYTGGTQVPSCRHETQDRREPFELRLLCRAQWVLLEERDDACGQVRP